MLFLWYPKCTTCQKAKAFLDERGVSYEARDIKLENPTAEELRGWWGEERNAPEEVLQHQRPPVQGSGPEGQAAGDERGGAAGPAGHRRDAGKAAHPGGGRTSSAPASARRSGRRHWDDPAVRLRPAGWYHQGGVPAGVPPDVRRRRPVFHPVFSPLRISIS